MKHFDQKRLSFILSVAIFVLLVVMASSQVDFDWLFMFRDLSKVFSRITSLYFPLDFSDWGEMIKGMGITILNSLASAATGMILAFFAAISLSKKTSVHPMIQTIVRLIASLTRNIPEGIWAITLLMTFWSGNFLAYIVLSIITFGFLTRVFADTIDETGIESIEALEATGASHWQIITQAVIPETLPAMVSWALYGVENNIRSSTLVGMLTGGGIGYLVGIYKHFRNFQSLSVTVIIIVVVILVMDQLTVQIRKRLMA